MIYRTLGRTRLQVSLLGMGTGGHDPLGQKSGRPESEMLASGGNGQPMREDFLARGLASYSAGVSTEFQASLESADDN